VCSHEVATSPATELPATEQLSTVEIIEQVNASGKITDAQASKLTARRQNCQDEDWR